MGGASEKMLDLLQKKVGEVVSRELLSETAKIHDWQRQIRTLRQDGWDIESVNEGYILHSLIKADSIKKRGAISNKLRYAVLQRDNSTCQRCGKTVQDGIKLEADHKIPVEWGGETEIDNLWTLCNICNGGKKHFFSDFDQKIMALVMKETSGYKRLVKFFKLNPDLAIEPYKLSVISGIRDWERTLRLIRTKEKMKIKWLRKSEINRNEAYIFSTNTPNNY